MKLAGEANLPPYEVVAFLCLFGAIMMVVKGAAQGSVTALWPRRPGRQIARIVLALSCSMANAVALTHLPLTLFYAAVFTAPMVIALLAAVFLRERLTAAQTGAIMAGFAGVVVAIDPVDSLTRGDWTGYAAVLVSVLCFSTSVVWLRVITRSETSDSIAFFTSLVGIALCGVPMLLYAAPVSAATLLLLFAMAVFTLIGNLCNFTALRLTTAATVSQFHYTQIVTGTLLGFLIWHDVPVLHTVIGVGIIVGAGLYIAAQQHKDKSIPGQDAATGSGVASSLATPHAASSSALAGEG
jgi:drug/metabolite transporter (DMT)-like permease